MSDVLTTPVQFVKGVGPYLSKIFNKKGLSTVQDLLYYFPFRYIDRRGINTIRTLTAGKERSIVATVVGMEGSRGGYGVRKRLEMLVEDGSGVAIVQWFHFNQRYLQKKYPAGKKLLISGECQVYQHKKQFIHPDIEEWEDDPEQPRQTIVPVYPLTEGLHQKTVRKIIGYCLDHYLDSLLDNPVSVRAEGSAKISLPESVLYIHRPPANANIAEFSEWRSPWHQRVIYDELFYFQLGLALKKTELMRSPGFAIQNDGKLIKQCLQLLPFQLTPAQERVILEIKQGMGGDVPSNRLLQGDVGSGKTLVAFLAALHVIESGLQAALMAPTEILADQHYQKLGSWAESLGVRTALLTGSLTKSKRQVLLKALEGRELDLIMGTHALLEPDVVFKRLGLVIIDEQHRFGVKQRALLQSRINIEGTRPHTLVMTATPIPRTLAMSLYGDLDISFIDEMPIGRKPITTHVYHEKMRSQAYQLVEQEIGQGRQAYFIYPLIEESEKVDLKNAQDMAQQLKVRFGNFQVGLLHGRLSSDQKERIMGEFQAGRLHILVATTVVEVGVDVPNASIIMIEHAERFGLSQLHQLRGRVGRSYHQSYCLLMATYAQSEESRFRLRAMESTHNGLKLAEQDLELRGPGDFLGTRQHGLPEFRLANLMRDQSLLQAARRRAFEIITQDPALAENQHLPLKVTLRNRWADKLALGEIA